MQTNLVGKKFNGRTIVAMLYGYKGIPYVYTLDQTGQLYKCKLDEVRFTPEDAKAILGE